jgi:uncharacterized membrane protein
MWTTNAHFLFIIITIVFVLYFEIKKYHVFDFILSQVTLAIVALWIVYTEI